MLLLLLVGCLSDGSDTDRQELDPEPVLEGWILFSQVYSGESVQMWLYGFDEAPVSPITPDDNVYWYGRWSPHADRIGLSRHTDVYVMGTDGSDLRKIIGGQGQQIHPAWSPGGQRLAYQGHASPDYEIYVIDVDDPEAKRQQVSFNEENDFTPDWSSDGSFLVAVRDVGSQKQLIRYDVATGEDTQITNLSGDCERPRISPDSTQVVFQRYFGGTTALYLTAADGSEEARALTAQGYNLMPAWAPDGQSIAYVGERDGQIDAFVMDLDGRELLQITDDYYEERDMDWRGLSQSDGL
jgi:Tol biopolymer transport system component